MTSRRDQMVHYRETFYQDLLYNISNFQAIRPKFNFHKIYAGSFDIIKLLIFFYTNILKISIHDAIISHTLLQNYYFFPYRPFF